MWTTLNLEKDLWDLQIKDRETFTNYYARTMGIPNNMQFHGEKIKDVVIMEKISHPLAQNSIMLPIQ